MGVADGRGVGKVPHTPWEGRRRLPGGGDSLSCVPVKSRSLPICGGEDGGKNIVPSGGTPGRPGNSVRVELGRGTVREVSRGCKAKKHSSLVTDNGEDSQSWRRVGYAVGRCGISLQGADSARAGFVCC